jgi:hypothetical protein
VPSKKLVAAWWPETENIGEEGGKEKDDVRGSGGGVCSFIGAIRWGYGTGGGYGEGVEEDQQKNQSIGGRSREVDGDGSRIGKVLKSQLNNGLYKTKATGQ